MAHILPGAPGITVLWLPISVPGTLGARIKGRGAAYHVAVSEAPSLHDFFNNNPNANSHFYVRKDGTIEQYIDLDLQCWASAAGNKTLVGVETQGGVTNADGEPWTDAQVASLAYLARYLHDTEGTPLQVMTDSLPGTRGIGYHRLGIDPWRVAGGEVWSSSRGKICPGAAKINQMGQIVALAAGAPAPAPAPVPAPVPAPAPQPVRFRVPAPAWTLPAGHKIGDIKGPANVHGGFYPAERPMVEFVQRVLIASGCVPGVPASQWRTSGWADGKFDTNYSLPALRTWFARYRGGQPDHDHVWADDYRFMASQEFTA